LKQPRGRLPRPDEFLLFFVQSVCVLLSLLDSETFEFAFLALERLASVELADRIAERAGGRYVSFAADLVVFGPQRRGKCWIAFWVGSRPLQSA
jgi:hypothetical protein